MGAGSWMNLFLTALIVVFAGLTYFALRAAIRRDRPEIASITPAHKAGSYRLYVINNRAGNITLRSIRVTRKTGRWSSQAVSFAWNPEHSDPYSIPGVISRSMPSQPIYVIKDQIYIDLDVHDYNPAHEYLVSISTSLGRTKTCNLYPQDNQGGDCSE